MSYDPLNSIDNSLWQINERQKRQEQRARNGGYTDGEMFLGLVFAVLRKLPLGIRLVVVTALVLGSAWYFFSGEILQVLHQ